MVFLSVDNTFPLCRNLFDDHIRSWVMNLFRWSIVGLLCFGVIGVGLSTGIVEFDQGQSFEYESATVTAVDNESRELATVDVRIADTDSKRYLGLSDTESLGADEGMLFVYETQQEPTFVMRDMSFPIDIVFIGSDGTVTTIHHAEANDDSLFEGTAQYVLEVPYHYTTENGIQVGDRIEIPERFS